MADSGSVRIHRVGQVSVVVLDRPVKYNALGTGLLNELKRALPASAASSAAIVLAAEGKHFCVGADLSEVIEAYGDQNRIGAFLGLFHQVTDSIAASEVPVIAAVQGFALAGGLELALAADLIVAADDAEFGDQHINVDLIPGGGGSQRLPRSIGTRRALALQMLGNRIDAHLASQWGLVHSVHTPESLREQALDLAAQLAIRDRPAIARIRKLSRVASKCSLSDGLAIELGTAVDHLSGSELPNGLRHFASGLRNRDNQSAPPAPDR